ncbi:hypothetical protein IPG36_00650 [bacterium]|nr:MAG: hypothetical protein IPG36_00650 [bacterium]
MSKHPASQSHQEQGFIMLTALMMAFVLSSLGMIAAQLLISNARFTQYETRSARAMQVAEAGINYYLWHLSHNSADYKDGGTTPANPPYGPYTHNYYDNDGNLLGTYTLNITPPASGSTITTIESIGQVPHFSGTRTILAQIGQPSFANYIFLSDVELRFSPTSTTTGPVHSNVGIEFNGTNNGSVTAANTTYTNGSGNHNGVWGTGGPTSQWQYPVPSVDFTEVTADLSSLSTMAQSNGIYLNNSGGIGYYFVLKSNGTIDVYRVNSEGSSGINTTFIQNRAAPANGILFSTQNVWISGTSWPGRITVVAARLPDNSSSRRSIKITNNLTYAAKDGSAAIGLIAQNDVFVPRYVPNTMEVNAALLSQYGSVGYDTTNGGLKTSFTLYGAVAQNLNDYGFKTTGCGSYCNGFPTTNYNFDSHLIFAPPPQYPTTGNYSVLNWREQLFNP